MDRCLEEDIIIGQKKRLIEELTILQELIDEKEIAIDKAKLAIFQEELAIKDELAIEKARMQRFEEELAITTGTKSKSPPQTITDDW